MPETKPYPVVYRHGPDSVNEPFVEARSSREGVNHLSAYTILKRDLWELFEFVEPCPANQGTFSHRSFELLLRACTEVESNFKTVLRANGHKVDSLTMRRYSDLDGPMKLSAYEVSCVGFNLPSFRPFASFADVNPKLRSPVWYRAYNDAKHDRVNNFPSASMENVVQALGGLYVALTAQYGFHFDVYLGLRQSTPAVQYDLFGCSRQPTWTDDERYDFDWRKLKTTPNPYKKGSSGGSVGARSS